MKYYKDQLAKMSNSQKIKVTSGNGETNWMDLNNESAAALIEYFQLNDWVKKNNRSDFETGAPNATCNDFVLTAINDYDCYQLLKGGYKAADLYKHNSYLNGLDLNDLDFTWINAYLADSMADELCEKCGENYSTKSVNSNPFDLTSDFINVCDECLK